ncbi:MAG: glycoside hydrolase family 127 protein, partial [Angelakisella sp.]
EENLFWPKYVMMKAFICYYEATGEQRILDFMLRYMRFCNLKMDTFKTSGWNESRGGDFVYAIYWLYDRTSESFLLELAGKVNRGTLDWTDFMEELPFVRPTKCYYDFSTIFRETTRSSLYHVMAFHKTHIVNVTMAIKQPLMLYRETGQARYLDAVYHGLQSLYRCHGQVAGIFSGDEHLSGTSPTQGSELCSVVEYLFSLQLLLEATGDTLFADLLERVAYNALPATITEDFKGHQYDQQANQVLVSLDERDWYNNDPDSNLFGFEPNFGCCLANLHQGWPKFAKNAFMTGEDGLYATVYLPIQVKTSIGGIALTVTEQTVYPVEGEVQFTFSCEQPVTTSFFLRIPGWCTDYTITVNGTPIQASTQGGYAVVARTYCQGDIVVLSMAMEAVVNRQGWYHNGATVERGPLIFGLKLTEAWKALPYGTSDFPDYEVRTQDNWNIALDLSSPLEVVMDKSKITHQLFSSKSCPVSIKTKGWLLPDWNLVHHSAGDLPCSPVPKQATTEHKEIELIPYGATALRVSLFPWC